MRENMPAWNTHVNKEKSKAIYIKNSDKTIMPNEVKLNFNASRSQSTIVGRARRYDSPS